MRRLILSSPSKEQKNRMDTLLKQLEELAPLAEAATEGPWVATPVYPAHVLLPLAEGQHHALAAKTTPDDAAFIAAARNLLTPATIATFRAALATPAAPAAVEGEAEDDPAIVPLSAQYWYKAGKKAKDSNEAAFCFAEAYKHLGNHLYALHQAAALAPPAAPAAGEAWVPVGEALPEVQANMKISLPVLVASALNGWVHVRQYEPGSETWYDPEHGVDERKGRYSHWQPLPAPPCAR